jgi:hypothetical protein
MFFDFNRPSNAIKFLTDDNNEFTLASGATSVVQTFDVSPGTGAIQVDPLDTDDFWVCSDGGILTVTLPLDFILIVGSFGSSSRP